MNVAIIDYDSGNLRSVSKSFERSISDLSINCKVSVTNDSELVKNADRIVLPGVGAFSDCRRGLMAIDGMIDALNSAVIEQQKPFMGICVGMQLMATIGREHEDVNGLGWISGEVIALEPQDKTLKIPHMGWNTIDLTCQHVIFDGIRTGKNGLHAYFVHSYQFVPEKYDDTIATFDYSGKFVAVVGRENMIGLQFHPEKSQQFGLKLISNFLKWKP